MTKKRKESVQRWVLVDNNGHYASDDMGGNFVEDLEEAYIFVAQPKETVAVRAADVIVTLVRGAN